MTGRSFIAAIFAILVMAGDGHAAFADVVVIVSPKSPLTSLSKYHVADIFLGRINRLSNGEPVVPVDLSEGSPVRDAFYLEFTGKSPAQLKAYWSRLIFTGRGRPPVDVADAKAMKTMVARNPDAIGYIDSKMVDDTVRVLTIK